ncbi:winged helix-turn-helix domain-containing protein [Emticicia fluvialis]|uniref:winged helix-turn-helix domain-containing protein n=1 Tax=Emticicia fluvialis TaxID=2974474 RepID=UPI002165BE93|nr:winged helix-turn-helix domain-containing protein [Emticicia fluvialis]
MKPKIYITCLAILAALALSAGTWSVDDSGGFLEKRAILVVREIGHKLLLHAGDSTSTILPVKKVGERIFQLEFQSKFSFVPDTLVKIVHERLANAQLPLDYMVNVYSCNKPDVIFGYEVRAKQTDVMPCLGRKQTTDCYQIQIEFTGDYQKTSGMNVWWAVGFILTGGTLFSIFSARLFRLVKKNTKVANSPFVMLGSFYFYPERALLVKGKDEVELSDKEARLLSIFAANQNQVVEREKLLKEVWEDEGVYVVGRSLDVFVSKLRKKLQADESIRITSIHGKGYKLEVSA